MTDKMIIHQTFWYSRSSQKLETAFDSNHNFSQVSEGLESNSISLLEFPTSLANTIVYIDANYTAITKYTEESQSVLHITTCPTGGFHSYI